MLHRNLWSITLGVTLFSFAALQAQPVKRPLPKGVKLLRDLSYVEKGHERQKLDLYLPEKVEGNLPVIVWIHGGAWKAGSKENCPVMNYCLQGYVVASVNYRLSQHARFPSQIEDCKAALRWLRAHAKEYHLNPEKIGVIGASAGGHLVALLGTSGDIKDLEGNLGQRKMSSRVQCVVDLYGPTDFLQMRGNHNDARSPESLLIGGPIAENKDKVARANPITYVTKDDPPFLIIHGDRDPLVPFSQSEILQSALEKAGVKSTLIKVPGGGHGGQGFMNGKNGEKIKEFFAEHLKK